MRRRRFLASAAAAAAGTALPGEALSPLARQAGSLPQRSPTDGVFDRALVFDALSVDADWGDATFEALARSGLTGIHTSLPNANLQAALRGLATWQERFDRHPDRLLKLRTGADLQAAKQGQSAAVMLGFQNATMVESDVRNLDTLHGLGTRCIQLTYNSRNLLGDGCTERTNAGLSDFGVKVVERMNELRIVVDLSHCGEQTSKDGITLSKRGAAFTHTMCQAVHDHVRAKSDELLRAIADKGGMIGIATLGYFVSPRPDATLEDYLLHVDHAVKVAGIDHVGIASDYSLRGIEATATRESWYVPRLTSFKPVYNVRWPPWIPELDPPERFRAIAHGLSRRGYKTDAVLKILGGNWSRYLSDVLG